MNRKERVFVKRCLTTSATGASWWVPGIVIGCLLCLLAVILLVAVKEAPSPYLFLGLFVIGLAVVKVSLDERRNRILAGILQKYEQALADSEGKSSPADTTEA